MDELETALDDATRDAHSRLTFLDAPDRGRAPVICDGSTAELASRIISIADHGGQADAALLSGLIEAYKIVTGGVWEHGATQTEEIERIREHLGTWRMMRALDRPVDLTAVYRAWDGAVQEHAARLARAQMHRVVALLALRRSEWSLRRIAALVGVNHNAVAKALTTAERRTDIDQGFLGRLLDQT